MPYSTEMPRPIETLLSLPRVRLAHRVPILETETLIHRLVNHVEHRPRLIKNALEVSRGSVRQFSLDDQGLSALLEETTAAEYVVTKRSKRIVEEMLNDICEDGSVFKDFETEIEPLCHLSQQLRDVSRLADGLADRTREESIDVARVLLIDLPRRETEPPIA